MNEKLHNESTNVELKGLADKFYVISKMMIDDKPYFLLENEVYGDEKPDVICDENKNVLIENAYNGYLDLFEDYENTPLANVFNDEQIAILIECHNLGFDVEILANSKYDIVQMCAIKDGLEQGLDVSKYSNPKLTDEMPLTPNQLAFIESENNLSSNGTKKATPIQAKLLQKREPTFKELCELHKQNTVKKTTSHTNIVPPPIRY